MHLVTTPMRAKPQSVLVDQRMGGRSIRLGMESVPTRGLSGWPKVPARAAATIVEDMMAATEQWPGPEQEAW